MQELSGPIPAPEILAGYANIRPDLVDRIVTMAEKEQANRHAQGNRALEVANNRARLGQLFGLTIALAGLGVAAYCARYGAPVTGAILGAVDLVALVTAFLAGNGRRRKRSAPPASLPTKRDS